MNPQFASMTIDEFCKMHRISRGGFYLLAKQGEAPATFKIGRHVRISERAAHEWLAARDPASAKGFEKETP